MLGVHEAQLHPVLLLGVVENQVFENLGGFGHLVLFLVEEASQVVPLLFGDAALRLEVTHGNQDVVECLVVVLKLVVTLSEKHISVRVGRFRHVEPRQQRSDAVLPALLHEIELSDGVTRVDLHSQRDVWLADDVLIRLEGTREVFTRVINKRVEVVDVGEFVAVQLVVATSRQHVIEDLGREVHILRFSSGLCLRQLFVNLVTESRGPASFLFFFGRSLVLSLNR